MQWIRKASLRWRLFQLSKQTAKASAFMPNRALCQQMLTLLECELFEHYSPKHGLGISIKNQHPNIESFTAKIKDSVRMVKEDKIIPTDWAVGQELTISLDRFLTTNDGYYGNRQVLIRSFKSAGLELCDYMSVSDDVQVGLPEHNLRMLTKVFVDIRNTAQLLLEAGLTI